MSLMNSEAVRAAIKALLCKPFANHIFNQHKLTPAAVFANFVEMSICTSSTEGSGHVGRQEVLALAHRRKH
jgi:hypothetical protein